MSQNRRETECAQCGRFIASWEICPFCRAFNPKRPVVRLIKYTSPILTILGLFLLAHLGRVYGSPQVKIAELGRKTNFAQVQIAGIVPGELRLHASDDETGESRNSLEFDVDDGTGVIRVRAYDDATQELMAAGELPNFGDRVTLVGNYQFKGRRQFMILSSPFDLEIDRPRPAQATAISDLSRLRADQFPVGRRVKVTGRVAQARLTAYDLLCKLEDPDRNTITLKLSRDLFAAYGLTRGDTVTWPIPQPGEYLTCYGALNWYKGKSGEFPELLPAAPSEIIKADAAAWKKDNG